MTEPSSELEPPARAGGLRVALVEDDATTREALRILLSGQPGLSVNGAFGAGRELLAVIDQLELDIVLVDLGLPDLRGDELIGAIKSRRPVWEVMAYTISEARDSVFAALRAGATGYILKGSPPSELIEALFELGRGGAPMSPRIARSVVRTFQDAASIAEDYMLTSRERDVLQGLERGRSYKDVASDLSISPHTVHSHIKRVYEKLHAQSRDEAVRIGRLKGLI